MASRVLTVELMGDARDVLKAFDKTEKKAGGLTGKLKGVGGALGGVAKIAGGFVLAQGLLKAPGVISDIAGTARDLELQMEKSGIVFGDQLDVVQDWADSNAAAMGLTTRQATNLSATFADLLIPMGFTREAAAGMSTDVVGLSGALAEWSGGQKTASEVSEVLAKAMLGERDGLKALGISITEADVKQRLLANGTSDLTGQALEQAKAMATQELIFEKSTDAQAAYADGAGTAARRQAELSAKFRELKEDIAVGLQPALLAAGAMVTDVLVPAFDAGVAMFKERVLPALTELAARFRTDILPVIRDEVIPTVERFAKDVLGALVQTFQDDVMPKLETFAAVLRDTVIPAVLDLGNFVREKMFPPLKAVIDFLANNKEFIVGAAVAISAMLVPAFVAWAVSAGAAAVATVVATAPVIAIGVAIAALVGGIIWAIRHWDEITAAVGRFTDYLVGVAQGAIGGFTTAVSGFFGGMRDAVMGTVNDVVGFFTELPGRLAGLAGKILGAATDIGRGIKDGIVGGIKEIAGDIKEIADSVGNALRGAMNQTLRWAHDNIRISIPGFDPPGPGSIPGFDWNFPLMQFDTGGVVPGPRGMAQLAMVHGGETILPTHKQGFGGGEFHVHVNVTRPHGSASEIADEVREAIELLRDQGRLS